MRLRRTLPVESTTWTPVPTDQRLPLVDIIRGFALWGVLLANIIWLSQDVATTPRQLETLPTASLDRWTRSLIRFFVDGKFYTLFAFLFGLSFSLQAQRFERKGSDLNTLFFRRIGFLFLIGIAHTFLLWYGDILHLYALIGIFLLAFRNVSHRTLFASALLFSVFLPVSIQIIQDLAPEFGALTYLSASISSFVTGENVWTPQTRFSAFTSTSYTRLFLANIDVIITGVYLSGYAWHYVPAIFGKFLFGLYTGRKGILERCEEHVPLFRRLFFWGVIIGVIGNGTWVLADVLIRNQILSETSSWNVVFYLPSSLGSLALAAAYLSAVILLFQKEWWRERMRFLAPVGRLALSNYLFQTIINLFIFYGFGLNQLGKIGASTGCLLALLIFSLQVLFSNWWVHRFYFGPVEWLWRSFTYGKPQPFYRILTHDKAFARTV